MSYYGNNILVEMLYGDNYDDESDYDNDSCEVVRYESDDFDDDEFSVNEYDCPFDENGNYIEPDFDNVILDEDFSK